ncbi:hypothetical protein HDU80_010962 [Chytriomyces hyalinus]|nr:hypothetical protein HDU80_010962 [Chytriomyces hyalinus]
MGSSSPVTGVPTHSGTAHASSANHVDLLAMSVAQTAQWLRDSAMPPDIAAAFERHTISGPCLPSLTHALLDEMGVKSVGTQKRILLMIQNASHTVKSTSPSHINASNSTPYDKFRIEPRSSSSNLTGGSNTMSGAASFSPPSATLTSSKFASLDRQTGSKGASPNIAPRSSSKNVSGSGSSSGATLLRSTNASTSSTNGTIVPLDTHADSTHASSESPTTPQPRFPFPLFPSGGTLPHLSSALSSGGGGFAESSPKAAGDGKFRTLGAAIVGSGGAAGSNGSGGAAASAAPGSSVGKTGNVGYRTLQSSFSNNRLQVSTLDSSADRVIMKVQDGNQETHRIDITAYAGDAYAVRRAVFRKFHVPEESHRSYALFHAAGNPPPPPHTPQPSSAGLSSTNPSLSSATTTAAAGASSNSNPSSAATILSDEDILRLFQVKSTGGSGEVVHEFILRRMFMYSKRSLEGPLSSGSSGSLPRNPGGASAAGGGMDSGASTMMFAASTNSSSSSSGNMGTVPVQLLQQQQQQQQAVAAAAALAKSLRVFGLLGTGNGEQPGGSGNGGGSSSGGGGGGGGTLSTASSVASLASAASAGNALSTGTSLNALNTGNSGFISSNGYFDAPPRSKRSLSVRIADGSSVAVLQKQQFQQQQLLQQQQQQQQLREKEKEKEHQLQREQLLAPQTGGSKSIRRSSKRASYKNVRKSGFSLDNDGAVGGGVNRGGISIPPRSSRVAALRGNSMDDNDDADPSPAAAAAAARRGSKFKSFFAERPRDEAIADKLKKYFPELAEEEGEAVLAAFDSSSNAAAATPVSVLGGVGSVDITSLVRPRLDSKPQQYMPPTPILPSPTLGDDGLKLNRSSARVEIPQRSRSIKNKVEEAVRENRRKSVMSSIAVRRRLSVAASALLKEGGGDAGSPAETTSSGGGIQKRRGVSSVVRIGISNKSTSSSTASTPGVLSPKSISMLEETPASPRTPSTPSASPMDSEDASKRDDGSSVTGTDDEGATRDESLSMEGVETKRKTLPPVLNWTQGRMIGQGAFGKVFHALNMDTGEIMAVKQVLLGPSSTPSGKPLNAAAESNKKRQTEALERELEVLKELDHENIVRYLGYELKQGSLNLFLQYVSGGSIASLLSKTGKLDLTVARYFTFQILCGMAYLHSRNIIHRDIKGGNILVDADGICKISDFGTSKKNAYQMAYQRVTRMSMQGTIPWMAPEVAKGKGYSAKVDIWSVGCMVLEMMTGLPPWHKVSASVIYLLGTGNSPPIADDLPQLAKDFLKLCFLIDPEQRPTALDLVDHEFCRLSREESEMFDFRSWVLAAEEKRALELGDQVDDSDSETDSESDSDSDSDSESPSEQDSESEQEEDSEIEEDEEEVEIEEV